MINTKTVLLFITIIMGDFATLSAQDSAIYFPTGMKWKEVIAEPHYLPMDTTRATIWQIGPDTIVNNFNYKQVVREGKTINIWLREDAGKVWLLTEEYPREILLYNFNWIPDEVLYTEYIRETDNGTDVFKDEFSVDDYKTTTCGNHSYEYIFGNDHTTIRGIGRVAELHRNSGLLGYSKMKTILPGLMFFKVLWIVRDNKEVFRSEIAEEWTCEIPATAWANVEINETTFPDENFRNWVLAQSYGQDGVLTDEEIANVSMIDVYHKGIQSLKGIEFFTSLTWLRCYGNQLTTLDVSKNTSLSLLHCMNNRLTTLNVSNIKTLETLQCHENQLTTLDVSGCSALTGLMCDDNQLTTLDVSGCTALTTISCNHNQLTTLDLSENTALTNVSCMQNQIKGEGMDALVESLPTVSKGKLVIIRYQDEQNIMTKAQVVVARAKGWTPQRWDPYILWTDYEGSDDATTTYFPEGTRWTEIRLDTLKYDSWYSKVGDEWVPNFETIEYRVQGEYGKASDNYWNAPYKCVYTNSAEWTDSLTLLISEGEINELPTGVLATVLDVDQPLCPSSYPFEWEIGTMIRFKSILAANATAIFHPGSFDFGVVEEIREGDFGGVRPLKYSDVKGVRMIQGIGVATWNDGECVFGPLEPYNASPTPHEESRHYRSMLVHFERDGEVLYNVWPEKEAIEVESVTFTRNLLATIILPTEPDAGKGKYYRLDRCEGNEVVFEQELQPRAHVPYIIEPSEDFSIDPSDLDLEGLSNDTVSIDGISFIGTYGREELPDYTGGSFYIDIIDTTPDCGFMAETGKGAVVGALRAWLQVNWDDPIDHGGAKSPEEKKLIVLKDNPDGISQLVNCKLSNGKCYDLSGRRIINRKSLPIKGAGASGIYIEDGKKKVTK